MPAAQRIERRDFIAGAAALGALPMLVPAAQSGAARNATARAPAGEFAGHADGMVLAFKGMRYGRAARFQPPVAVADTTDRQAAEQFGPMAPQAGANAASASEDCLFLNVWTPQVSVQARRAVMVYFHGGAYSSGTVTVPLTDGARLAEQGDVVVVTVNHRLNALGYAWLSGFGPAWAASGNLGQLDLVLALHWVRRNITAFGGDPGRVTVFGQSGGGAKIATLMAMPLAAGLFHRAATMSGQQVTASGPANAARRSAVLFEALQLRPDDIAGLIAMPWQRIVAALAEPDPITVGGLYFGPVRDGVLLPRHPFWPDAAPQSRHIPMILGNTLEETRAFIDPRGPKLVGLDFDNLAARIAPEIRIDLPPQEVVAFYRALHPTWTAERLFYAITTDGRSWPGQWLEADARAASGARDTWVYRFDRQSQRDAAHGAAHADDIAYVFGTLDAPGSHADNSPASRRVRDGLQGALVSLAKAGQPQLQATAWPRYSLPRRDTLLVDADFKLAADPRGAERAFWSQAPYIQPGS